MEIDQTLINDFEIEVNEHLQNLEEDFLALENQSENPDRELIDKIFRSMHSIKGGAGFLKLDKLASVAHAMEAILQRMRSEEIKPEPHFIEALLTGSDLLKLLMSDLSNSNSIDVQETISKLRKVIQDISLNESKPDNKKNDRIQSKPSTNETKHVNSCPHERMQLRKIQNGTQMFVLKFDLMEVNILHNITPSELIKNLMNMGSIQDASIETECDNLSSTIAYPLNFELIYETKLDMSEISLLFFLKSDQIVALSKPTSEHIKIDSRKKTSSSNQKPSSIKNEPYSDLNNQKVPMQDSSLTTPKVFDIKNKLIQSSQPETKDSNSLIHKSEENKLGSESIAINIKKDKIASSSIRISLKILDKLMNLAGELVLVRNRLLMEVSQKNKKIYNISRDLDIVTSDLQETVMLTRMQPVGNVFTRLPRIVRDISQRLNKNIDIAISGKEVEVDKNILEFLTDPLIHIIRNCCDHGIENTEERIKIGKSKIGTIEVLAYHKGGMIIIEVRDNGRGINIESLKDRALAYKIKTEKELERMNDKEIIALIMLPGFTTVKTMSEVSGRGVGMDVVKTSIEQLGGTIDIDSKFGEGTTFYLTLPLTLAIIPSLIVMVGHERYAIPQVNLDEMVRLYDDEVFKKIERSSNQEVYRLRESLLPMVRLKEVLVRPERFNEKDRLDITEKYKRIAKKELSKETYKGKSLIFAVVKMGFRRFGLIVDRMRGTEEIVVNPLPDALKTISIYSGTTIMGDGEVGLVLDIDGIAKHATVECNTEYEKISISYSRLGPPDIQRVLLFESGQKEQFAVPLMFVKRVEPIRQNLIEQMGREHQKEFISIDNETIYIIRLDQYMDVSNCESLDQLYLLLPKRTRVPFGILFSKLNGIQEMPEDINIDHYKMPGVLGTTIIRNRFSLLINIQYLIDQVESQWRGTSSQPYETNYKATHNNRILLVEDAPFFRQLAKEYLESSGYEVITADNGINALELLEHATFDLIISDIKMPKMDGWTFIQYVKRNERYKEIPAIALSSFYSEEHLQMSNSAGFDVHQKKINKQLLLQSVTDLLSRSKQTITIPTIKQEIN